MQIFTLKLPSLFYLKVLGTWKDIFLGYSSRCFLLSSRSIGITRFTSAHFQRSPRPSRFTNDKDTTIYLHSRDILALTSFANPCRSSERMAPCFLPLSRTRILSRKRRRRRLLIALRPTRRVNSTRRPPSLVDSQRASESANDARPSLIRSRDVTGERARDWRALERAANRRPEEIQTVHPHDPPPRSSTFLLYFACVVIAVAPVAPERPAGGLGSFTSRNRGA